LAGRTSDELTYWTFHSVTSGFFTDVVSRETVGMGVTGSGLFLSIFPHDVVALSE